MIWATLLVAAVHVSGYIKLLVSFPATFENGVHCMLVADCTVYDRLG